jgi:hypothetical protein
MDDSRDIPRRAGHAELVEACYAELLSELHEVSCWIAGEPNILEHDAARRAAYGCRVFGRRWGRVYPDLVTMRKVRSRRDEVT